jgi:hypothetical protein
MKKLALVIAAAGVLGLAAFVSAPAQAAATHLGVTQTSAQVEMSVVDVRWHRRWHSRGGWHRRWRSRHGW